MGSQSKFEGMVAAENAARQLVVDDGLLSRCDARNCVWREKVVKWCYDVADHLNEERTIVYVAMNILDRYCTTIAPPLDEKKYEIASLSSLFLAVHIAGSGLLTLQELVSMSRGGISLQDIVAEGTAITRSISWKHPIITPVDFVRAIIRLIPSLNSSEHKQALLDSSSYVIELALCDDFFSNVKPSNLAVAAVLNGLESNVCPGGKRVRHALMKATSFAISSFDEVTVLCARLLCIYNQSAENMLQCGPHLIEDEDIEENSAIVKVNQPLCITKRDLSALSDDDSASQKRAKLKL
jgi:Cyclin, N-terminal domain/Cyclin, C-terminal domain